MGAYRLGTGITYYTRINGQRRTIQGPSQAEATVYSTKRTRLCLTKISDDQYDYTIIAEDISTTNYRQEYQMLKIAREPNRQPQWYSKLHDHAVNTASGDTQNIHTYLGNAGCVTGTRDELITPFYSYNGYTILLCGKNKCFATDHFVISW